VRVSCKGISEGVRMKRNGILERISAILVMISVALVVGGTRACQEDYALGSQVKVKDTPEVTATPTEDGDTVTATPAPQGTATETPEGTEVPSSTATPRGTPTVQAGLFQELSGLSEKPVDVRAGTGGARPAAGAAGGNWLGNAFRKGGEEESPEGWIDSDGDGFADAVELSHESDPNDAMAVPAGIMSTRLDDRVRSFDSDLDGLSTGEELRLGSDPNSSDSDGDGIADGAEVLSGGNLLSQDDRYMDRDGDGLSDEYETENSLDPEQLDSDRDGLRDDLEVVVGSDGRNPDSDGDGVSDGKEFDLGSDPTAAERSK
jgi:hypothetical protein